MGCTDRAKPVPISLPIRNESAVDRISCRAMGGNIMSTFKTSELFHGLYLTLNYSFGKDIDSIRFGKFDGKDAAMVLHRDNEKASIIFGEFAESDFADWDFNLLQQESHPLNRIKVIGE